MLLNRINRMLISVSTEVSKIKLRFFDFRSSRIPKRRIRSPTFVKKWKLPRRLPMSGRNNKSLLSLLIVGFLWNNHVNSCDIKAFDICRHF